MEFATLLTQAELQAERGEYAQARDTALTLRERDPRHPYAIELLAESYAALKSWEPLAALLARPENSAALSPARARELSVRTLCEMLGRAVDAARLDQLKAAWEQAQPRYRQEPEALRAYARGPRMTTEFEDALVLTPSAAAAPGC